MKKNVVLNLSNNKILFGLLLLKIGAPLTPVLEEEGGVRVLVLDRVLQHRRVHERDVDRARHGHVHVALARHRSAQRHVTRASRETLRDDGVHRAVVQLAVLQGTATGRDSEFEKAV